MPPMCRTATMGLLMLSFVVLSLASAEVGTVEVDEMAYMQTQLAVEATKKASFNTQVADATLPPPTPPPNSTELAKETGVTLNAAGDLDYFLAGLTFNIECMIFFLMLFVLGLYCAPQLFAFRATGAYLEGEAKKKAQDAPIKWEATEWSCYKWIWYSFAAKRDDIIESSGLDAAMMLAFLDMGMEILALIGIPFAIILAPMYCTLGGNAAGDDKLSWPGINNVEYESWIFWPVAFSTWFVVVLTQQRLFSWMRFFINFREMWLADMPEPQDKTILVEGIPDKYCSDKALTKYFQQIYGEHTIERAMVVKKISSLEHDVEKYKKLDRRLKEILFSIKKAEAAQDYARETKLKDDETLCREEIDKLQSSIKENQRTIMAEAAKDPEESEIYATNGFVTFKERAVCEQAVLMRLSVADDEWVISHPPEPTDVIWSDLEQTMAGRAIWTALGYAGVAGLFLVYMPIIIAISKATSLENLPPSFVESLGESKDTVAGLLASVGLTFMACFLPTFLMLIFNICYTLKATRWAQLQLQTYYFWFLILFVLLITSIGSNLTTFLVEVAQSPFSLFSILAEQMPFTSHFYMNWMVVQWTTDCMSMMRYVQVFKYMIFKRLFEPEDARQMSEPEDQDYYGTGGRSARFSLVLIVGLVFSSNCPILVVLSFLSLFFSRLFFGYLIPYAESKKSDLGGAHFVLQLQHTHLGLLIYLILMVGLLLRRAATTGPGIVAAFSFLWWAISFHKFNHKLYWETLSFEHVAFMPSDGKKRECKVKQYHHDALDPKIFEKIAADTI